MATTLYVGNLAPRTTSAELGTVAGYFGTVRRVTVATDAEGNSRGYGFMEVDGDAAKVVQGLNGLRLHGQKLTVHAVRLPRP